MFTKAGLLIAVALVFLGFRWGKRKAREDALRRAEVRVIPAEQPRKEWLPVKLLLAVVILLLIIAILSSLGGRIG